MAKSKTTKADKPQPGKPTAEGDARRKGKMNVDWKNDPEILERLVKVADCLNKHKRAFQIAQETKVSIETARRDIARVRELWREDAKERINDARDVANAQYGALISQAWYDLEKVKKQTNPVRAAYMNTILRAQRQMDIVNGIAEKHEHSGPDGGPIEHKVVDLEKVRRKRWEQIAPNLRDMANKENNDTANVPEPEAADQKS